MKAIVTVIGKDRIGIVAKVSAVLMNDNVNINDISQNILGEIFTMTMLVDTPSQKDSFNKLQSDMNLLAQELGLDIRVQREEIFTVMHRI